MRILVSSEEARPAPAPIHTNNRGVFMVGTAIWFAILVTLVIIWLVTKNSLGTAIGVAATGTVIGVVTLFDLQRRARPGYKGNK